MNSHNHNYFYKYIKYKNKYKNLKGGAIKNIGLDFDGVIHENVGPDYKKSSRSPKELDIRYRFEEIHNKIFDYYCNQYNIFIITGRGKDQKKNIRRYLDACGINVDIIPDMNIYTLGGNGNKVNKAIELKLDEYYDDSYKEIQQFIDRKCEILVDIPKFRLFQTFPDITGTSRSIVEQIL
jgi:hypothetical protein